MTNTEKIRQEIERRLLEDYNSGDTEIDEVAQGVCAALLYFIDSLPKETVTDCYQLEEAAEEYARKYGKGAMGGAEYTKQDFIAGAKWQREQDHDACYQCKKNYDNVFFRGEQHAIEMMREEAIEVTIVNDWTYGKDPDHAIIPAIHQRIDGVKVDDKVKVYIFKEERK